VNLSERSSLRDVAAAVAGSLRAHGIRAVLTGGACAALCSTGAFRSWGLDFIVVGSAPRARMDAAMAAVGFEREGNRYRHPAARFFVEFPRGPLAIGHEYRIRPVSRRAGHGRIVMLSATDSCRDRLAAFSHWNDRQSLSVAVSVGLRDRVTLGAIRRWSLAEGAADGFEEFAAELKRARAGLVSGSRRRAARRASGSP
jgi:hypothetical protein